MNNKNHIDDIFKSKLDSYEPEYEPQHWLLLKEAMVASDKVIPKIAGSSYTWMVTGMLALLLSITGIYTFIIWYNLNDTESKVFLSNMPTVNSNTINSDDSKIIAENTKEIEPVAEFQNSPKTNQTTELIGAQQPKSHRNEIKSPHAHSPKAKPTIYKNFTSNPGLNAQINNSISSQESPTIFKGQLKSDAKIEKEVSKKEIKLQPEIGLVPEIKTVAEVSSDVVDTVSSVSNDYLALQASRGDKKQERNLLKAKRAKYKEMLPDTKINLANNFTTNPAFAGFSQTHSFKLGAMVYKPLFKPLDDFNVPFDYGMAYDFSFGKRKKYALGINYARYLGASEGSLALDVSFSYKFLLVRNHYLRIGVTAGYLVTDVNKTNLSFGDMIDSRAGFVYNTNESIPEKSVKNNLDISIGALYSHKNFFVGFSAFHLNAPEIGVLTKSKLKTLYSLQSGYNLKLSSSSSMLSVVDIKYYNQLFRVSPSLLFTIRKWYLLGVEFRNLKNAGLVIGYNFKNSFQISLRSGLPMQEGIIRNFGVIDYAGLSIRFQFGDRK